MISILPPTWSWSLHSESNLLESLLHADSSAYKKGAMRNIIKSPKSRALSLNNVLHNGILLHTQHTHTTHARAHRLREQQEEGEG